MSGPRRPWQDGHDASPSDAALVGDAVDALLGVEL